MTYDPFARGQHPVGVRSSTLQDASRKGRSMELELWYPAADRYRGQDLSPQTQDRYSIFASQQASQQAVRDADPVSASFPVIVFSLFTTSVIVRAHRAG